MDQVEEVKAKIDIVALISEYLPLKKSGRNFKALCPFHSEKTPSFMVSPELQIFKCFGCGVAGDAIKFLQLYEKMDFWEAVEFLASRVGIKLVRRRLSRNEQLKKRLYQINHLAAEFYHFLLTKHQLGKPVLDYLQQRGIKPATIEKFQLGFSPPKPEAVVEFLTKKGYSVAEILQTGLIIPTRGNSYWDRFRRRLVFPLYDHRGNLVGFSGRVVPSISPPEAPKYINTPETVIYHKGQALYGLWLTRQDIRQKNEVVIVEGEFDLISPYQAGVTNIVAIKGTAFTEEQAKLIRRFTENAIFALDADSAGIEAMKRSIQIAEAIGLNLKVALLPQGFKDPDELAQKDPKLLKETLAKAVLVWDFIIDAALKKFSATDPLGKKKIITETLPFLVKVENEVVRNHYLQKLAQALQVDLEAVLVELEKIKTKQTPSPSFLTQSLDQQQDRRYLLERYLLSLIFSHHQWQWLKDRSWQKWLIISKFKRIVKIVRKILKKKKKTTVKEIFSSLPEELKSGFEEIYLVSEKGAPVNDIEKEIKKALARLEIVELRRQLSLLVEKIARLEKERKTKELVRWEKEFVRLSQQLAELELDFSNN